MLAQNFRTAEELGISPAVFDGLHLVLRMFEKGELVWTSIQHMRPGGFNMSHEFPQNECGTAGCILGWARHLSGWKFNSGWKFDISQELPKSRELQRLYSGGSRSLNSITVEQAEHALRAYLVTGVADWG